jgi:acido-empty-quinoprotein group A
MKFRVIAFGLCSVLSITGSSFAQGLNPQVLGRAPTTAWPTYNGDYSGKRFSTLTQINRDNVHELTLAWEHRLSLSITNGISTVGGEGKSMTPQFPVEARFGGGLAKASPLMVHGVLYFAAPDHVWAVDARSGRAIWHFFWKTTGGIHIGDRGVGMYRDWLYFETPDDYFVSLDARTGKERWQYKIANVDRGYFATSAPIVIGNHVIVGISGDDSNLQGFLESRDPVTGKLQWIWYSTPRPGQPGSQTWPSAASMEHGGGMTWGEPTYDPELHLLYVPTGNPTPVQIGESRRGANLWTDSIVALNVNTGKMVWYFQCSPHDTHDWDSSEDPVLFSATIDGRRQKLLAQAGRNGLFFVLNRKTGKRLVGTRFIGTSNAYRGYNSRGEPIPDRMKEPQIGGALVSPSNGGATNWISPTYDPQTHLFYVNASESFSLYYRTTNDFDVRASEGFTETNLGGIGDSLRAIDVRTGAIKWIHNYAGTQGIAPRPEQNGGLLSTAGGLVFGGGTSSEVVAYDARSGRILWHSGIYAPVTNDPITYMLGSKQYLVVGAGDTLYAFSLQRQ